MKNKRKKVKFEKCCYNCKHLYNSSTKKHCPNMYKVGFNPCENFEFSALCKSFNLKKRK